MTAPLRAAGWREDGPGQSGHASKFIARRIASPDGYAAFTEMDMAEVRHLAGPMTYRWRLEASSAWSNAWCIDATRDVPTSVLLAANLAVTDPSPVRRPAWAQSFPGITVTRPAAPPPTSGPSTVIPPTCAELPKPRGR
ncbi:hypothetical protein GCM10023205_04530 [Yinghuangia aomiensis]|uniref:Uncharacterized protein n=1 Tax=Yinghuangia aomiensis TaxID=676205 RepID=A0ABP9GN15_9ACTN